ncbi:uncharacterized protein BYT42DRAFT_611655 [Radiomyces spectabilis]|uniref:uncharacterized protein n=1 Tax=Radiomyces spectabilis TaxID=64574 RepID=UPI0022206C23|nr:uncharacterized protein BYT42DRAFT_611655 [Radiomyces spectabilis]KAI8388633.1 hypothetical protein BYT42DRAFT_611655 [Radiomyces spectabilis]
MPNILSEKEQLVLDSEREIDWLKRQLQRYENVAEAKSLEHDVRRLTLDEVTENLERYKERLNTLRTQLDVITQFNLGKDALTRSLDGSHQVLSALYPPDSAPDTLKQAGLVEKQIEERDELLVRFMQTFESLREVKANLVNTQRQIIECHRANRQLMASIEEQNVSQSEIIVDMHDDLAAENPEALTERIREMQNRFEIARNVLIGLILESNIDWVNDERWLSVMLRIGNETD